MKYTLDDGAEIETTWEYGIKMNMYGTFIHLGEMALPVECLEDLNDPGLYEIALQAAKEMIMEHLIVTIRPIGDDEECI